MKGKSWFDGNVCCAIVVSVLLYAYTPRLVLFSRVRDTRAQTNRGSVATVHFHLLKYFFSFLLCKSTQTGRIHWRSCKAITKIITRRVGVVVRILIFCCIWECTFFRKATQVKQSSCVLSKWVRWQLSLFAIFLICWYFFFRSARTPKRV